MATGVSIPLRLTTAASATDAVIYIKKILGSGKATLIISNGEMEDFIKIVKSLETLLYYQKEFLKQLKMKEKSKNEDF